MKVCPKCGCENDDNDIVCDCGYQLFDDWDEPKKQTYYLEDISDTLLRIWGIARFFKCITIIGLIIVFIGVLVTLLSYM